MTGFSSAIGEFVIGQSPIQGTSIPVQGNTSLQQIIPMYLYVQYADDPDLQAFVSAFNELAQGYLDWFNQTPLAIYTSPQVSGQLLDWVAKGLYGITRPYLSAEPISVMGPLNTYEFNVLEANQSAIVSSGAYAATSDDVFKRIITWNFYKGDGNQFTVTWLKRRVMRFLTGTNGTDPGVDETYNISVTFSGSTVFIDFGNNNQFSTEVVLALSQGLANGSLQVPFQYNFVVIDGGSGFGEFAFGVSPFGGAI